MIEPAPDTAVDWPPWGGRAESRAPSVQRTAKPLTSLQNVKRCPDSDSGRRRATMLGQFPMY